MNLVQLIRKARLGVDAILPGGSASSMWADDEVVDLVGEAYDEILKKFRLTRRKWGMQTVNRADAAFTRYGETYTPMTALQVTSTQSALTLPPDFGEMVRILCVNDRSIRFLPAEMEAFHWVDLEQDAFDNSGNPLPNTPGALTFYYDIHDRILEVIPAVTGTFNLEIDYYPIKQPLYYSNAGTITVTTGSTTVTGVSTTWVTDGIFSRASGQEAELIVGSNSLTWASLRLDRAYPKVNAIANDTSLTLLVTPATGIVGAAQSYLLAMAPILPPDTHRWIARLASSLMLAKVSVELSQKYAMDVRRDFAENIAPLAVRRQTQESMVTEDAIEFGLSSAW